MLEQAIEYFKSGNYQQAHDLFEQMLEDEPDNGEVLFMLSMTAEQTQDLDTAHGFISRAVNVHADNPLYQHALGGIEMKRRQPKAALAAFSKAAELDANFTEAQVAIGYCHIVTGEFAKAETSLRIALQADSDHVPALTNLGTALLEQGKNAQAMSYLRQAVELQPDYAAAQAQLGRAFLLDGNVAFASQCFSNALAQHPNSPQLHELQIHAYRQAGLHEEAAKSAKKVLELGVETPEALFVLAQDAEAGNRLGRADNLYSRAIRIAPERTEFKLAYGAFLLQCGRYSDACGRLKPMIDDPAFAPNARLLYARACLEDGRHEESLATLDEGFENAWPKEASIIAAAALHASGETESALQKILPLDTSADIDLALFKAELQIALEDHAAAQATLKLVDKDELDEKYLRRFNALTAAALHGLGDYEAALAAVSIY